MVTNFDAVNATAENAMENATPLTLDREMMENSKTLVMDFTMENVVETPDDRARMVMVRRKCICYEHSGDNSNCHFHTYNPIWNQTTPLCIKIEPRQILGPPYPEVQPELVVDASVGVDKSNTAAEPVKVSVKVLSAFSRAKPLAEATSIFDGHDFMLDIGMSSWEKAYLANIE